MKLTPLEIRKQEFRKTLRGLDPVEVHTFLEMVAEHYEQLQEENMDLNRKMIEVETRLRTYKDNEKTLRDTMFNMQEVKKQSEESSRRQADIHIKEAELKAMEIVELARKESRSIREEVNWLKTQKDSFINRIRHVLVSQIELLSVMEIDDVLPAEARARLKAWQKGSIHDRGGQEQPAVADDDEDSVSDTQQTGADSTGSAAVKSDATEKKREIVTADDPEAKKTTEKSTKPDDNTDLSDEDIDDFFKKGLQIDDLIKTINKRELDK